MRETHAILIAVLVMHQMASADAIVVSRAMKATTIAEIFIEPDVIKIELEIGSPDLDGFRNLLPDELYEQLGHAPQPWSERLARFFAEDLVIRSGDGEPLCGVLRSVSARPRIRRDDVTGDPLSAEENESELVVFAELAYHLTEHPRTLTIAPPGVGDTGRATASMGFIAYHMGLAVNDFRYLAQQETLHLDWDDPWYSRFTNSYLRRQYDAPLQAFLYVEAFEVRKEIIIRPRDLQQWLDLGLSDATVIRAEDQPALKTKIVEYLAAGSPVMIDGREVEPLQRRIDFVQRTLRTTGVVTPPQDLDLTSATLGVIFTYPTAGWPEEVTMHWELFSDRIDRVPSVATDEAGGMPFLLTPDDPILVWKNYLTNPTTPTLLALQPPPSPGEIDIPLLSAACVLAALVMCALIVARMRRERGVSRPMLAAAAVLIIAGVVLAPILRRTVAIPFAGADHISDDEASEIAHRLLTNIYRAFDFRTESDIYDTLERSASGKMLDTVYSDIYNGLLVKNQNGMRVSVDSVELVNIDVESPTDESAFAAVCTWNISGTVGHWGHIHRRTNQYEARVSITPVDGRWKLTALELYRQERVSGSVP